MPAAKLNREQNDALGDEVVLEGIMKGPGVTGTNVQRRKKEM